MPAATRRQRRGEWLVEVELQTAGALTTEATGAPLVLAARSYGFFTLEGADVPACRSAA